LPQVEEQLKQDGLVEGRMGSGSGARMVFEDGGFVAAAGTAAAGFWQLVARVFQRRVHDRSGGESEILERRKGANPAGKAGGGAGGIDGVES